jgi:phospholipid/cholesterol/gamma-HCH transport system ATP-binding protein
MGRTNLGPHSDLQPNEAPGPQIVVEDLTMAYGSFVLQRDLNFTINRGDIFIIMGGSGCGKSTLMRHLIGLQRPAKGKVYYGDVSFWDADDSVVEGILKNLGIMYQAGALWSSMTLAENIAISLEEYTDLKSAQIRELASLKLALVGLAGFEDYYPSEISGGMKKRAAIARAMALDPEILFLDEPSAGLDPISANLLDDLILELKESLGTTIVVVTHELASIFAVGNNSVFLDADSRTMIASGDPKRLLRECGHPTVQSFLTRGKPAADGTGALSEGSCFLAGTASPKQEKTAGVEKGETI